MQLGKEFAFGLPQDEYWLPPAGTGDISLTLDLDVENLGTKPYAPSSPVATSGIVSCFKTRIKTSISSEANNELTPKKTRINTSISSEANNELTPKKTN